MDYHPKEVVWAKVKGYPWWPAYINKLPAESDPNFKVIFFAQDTYALLQPKCVQKFSQNYAQYSKTKAKKFQKALQLANSSANRIPITPTKKQGSGRGKGSRKQVEDEEKVSFEEQSSPINEYGNQQQQSVIQHQQIVAIENETEEIDRKKLQKIENQLTEIINALQSSRTKDWKYKKYFENFLNQNSLNSQELLKSNLTKKIRFIIQTMKNMQIEQTQIDKMEDISSYFKRKVIDYLTDTSYYDFHLKIIDQGRHNKAEVQTQVMKIMKKKFHGQIKKEFIQILASLIGQEVCKNTKFRTKQLLTDLKVQDLLLQEGQHDPAVKSINSKAATQRFADNIILQYRE